MPTGSTIERSRREHKQAPLLPGAGGRTESSCTRKTPSAVQRSTGAAGACGAAAGASGGTYGGATTAGAWNAGADSPRGRSRRSPSRSYRLRSRNCNGRRWCGCDTRPAGTRREEGLRRGVCARGRARGGQHGRRNAQGHPRAACMRAAGHQCQAPCSKPTAAPLPPGRHSSSSVQKRQQLPRMQRAREKPQTLSAIPCSHA